MTLSVEILLTVIGGGSTVATVVFYAAFYIGKLTGRLDRVEQRQEDYEARLNRAGEKMSDIANVVQAMPDKFLTRKEAALWRGSRVEDVT